MEKLRELRKAKGLTLKELANDLNITHQVLSRWELGNVEPDNRMLTKIADYFNVSVDYLLDRPEYPEIRMSNFEHDMAGWYNEKLNMVLVGLCNIIDEYRPLLKAEDFRKSLDDILAIMVKMVAVTAGCQDKIDYDKDPKLILEKGYDGYIKLMAKYGIKHEDLNKLFVRDKKKP